MTRVIFTVYIDPHEIYNGDADFKSLKLAKNYNALTYRQEEYAKKCGADYKVYKIDDVYKIFLDNLDEYGVFETQYQCIQHYKHYMMRNLCNLYDEVLYLDLDVFINTDENIFETFDLSNGFGIYGYTDDKEKDVKNLEKGLLSYIPVVTSVSVKTAAMISLCSHANCTFPNYVFNTAVMLGNKKLCDEIDYFNELKDVKETLDELKENDNWWADYIRNYFTVNNETTFSYLVHKKKVKWQSLGEEWHYPYNSRNREREIPENAKFIHVINKDFIKVFAKAKYWEWCYI